MASRALTRLTITGVDELVRKLSKLPGESRDKVMRQAIRRGAQAIKKVMKAEAPVGDTKNLKRSIVIKRVRSKGVVYAVRPKYQIAPHAHLIEFGTADRVVENYHGVSGQKASVGFTPANPFVQRTRDRSKTEAFNVVVKESKKRVKYLAKMGTR